LFGAGWDNHAYLVGDELVFRIPHRKLGGDLMDTECQVLGYLCQQDLPLRIPEPRYQAKPGGGFPYAIAGYPLIPGVSADMVTWTDEERGKNAGTLGGFLAALHSVPIGIPTPRVDALKRADLLYRMPIVQEKTLNAPESYRALLVELSKTPLYEGAPVWVHGDLYAKHLIVGDDRQIAGVIDWGDVHVGDPALDIAIAWMFLPMQSWPKFRSAYGPIDENTWRRAQFRAMTHWAYLNEYAQDRKDGALQRELEFLYSNVVGSW
ncbi:MAG TPA: phosphotransferase, partial [Fimbriimonas sp.]|nr:phosphotransferase [Fimbriimonas sp.]